MSGRQSGRQVGVMRQGTDRAYETLRRRVVGGQFVPGTQLKEEPLARELGLSRTPIRAALRRLVDDGLATRDERQGVRVALWSDWDVEETFQLRIRLEPYAAALAAMRGGEALSTELAACNAAMARGISRGSRGLREVQAANSTFHHAVLRGAGSARLRQILENMIDMPVLRRSFSIHTAQALEQSLRHHLDLTMAIEAGDAELASHVMALHLRMAHHRFTRLREAMRRGDTRERAAA